MLNWQNFNKNLNRKELEVQIGKLITPENYGFKDGQWNLTDIMIEASSLRFVAMQKIAGEESNGKKIDGAEMSGPDGEAFKFRLKVLTRQACSRDKDGNQLNGWDRDEMGGDAPKDTDEPQQGDVVRIKGNFKGKDSRGNELVSAIRIQAKHRGEEIYNYTNKIVDQDGCIKCTYAQAHQILGKNGYKLTHPEFGPRDQQKDNKGKEQRTITNWHFKEVPVDYTVDDKPKRGRPRKEEAQIAQA